MLEKNEFIWSIPTKVMHIGKKTTLLHSPEFFCGLSMAGLCGHCGDCDDRITNGQCDL